MKTKSLVNIFTLFVLLVSLLGNVTTPARAAENLAASGTWSGLSGLVAGPVYAIATNGTDVFVGGAFNSAGGNANAKNIAKWDGSAWSALGTGLNGSVNAIAISGTDIYVGGNFTDAGGDVNADSIAKWDGSAWSAVGILPTTMVVNAIAISGTDIFAGYSATAALPNGDPRKGIIKWDGSSWSALGAGLGDFSVVNAIAISGADVYAGGSFVDAGGNANADNIAKWNGSTWSALGTGVNGGVKSIAFSAGNVFIGGEFTDAGGDINADHIAKWNGSTWAALGSGLNNTVFSMTSSGTDLYVGGDFTDTAHIAKWDGSAWSALGTGTNGTVSALAIIRGDLYVGGTFSDAGGALNTIFMARYQVTGATITVNTALNLVNNDGNCSLSEAIQSANTNSGVDACTPGLGPDTILFSDALGAATILLPANLPDISDAYGLTINGGGDITLNGSGASHPLQVLSGVSLTIDGITVTNGKSSTGYGGAITNDHGQLTILNSAFTNNMALGSGAIDNYGGILSVANSTFSGNSATTNYDGAIGSNGGTATITNSTFSNNSAPSSGAVGNSNGTMEITNSTFSGNQAFSGTGNGGAILNSASLTIANSTFSGNSAPYTGGGILNNYGTLTITNSTFSGNSANLGGGIFNVDQLNLTNTILANSPSGSDCFNYSTGTVTGSNNIIETDSAGSEACGTTSPLNVDPQLGALANNGGPTLTFGLLPGSPAINAADDVTCAAAPVSHTSQNRIRRPQGAHCDIGAFEAGVWAVFKSTAAQDGWILETAENGKKGGTMNSAAPTFNLGDDNFKKQYLGILSFDTKSLPDNAVITNVTFNIKKSAIIGGGNPVTTFQGFMVDIRKGSFGLPALQAGDFQAAVSKTYGPFSPAIASGWYTFNLTSAKSFVNKTTTNNGLTQIRLRFKLDDNNNAVANYLSLFSGNAPAVSRPQLIIEYYVP